MHYVYLTNNIVTDQCQVDPVTVFSPEYAAGFIEAPDEVTFGWSLVDGVWTAPPEPTPEQIQAQNKASATLFLQATDWTAPTSISDPVESQPYLANRQAFLSYRSQVRAIAINPPTTLVTNWPDLPEEQWATSQ